MFYLKKKIDCFCFCIKEASVKLNLPYAGYPLMPLLLIWYVCVLIDTQVDRL